MNRSKIPSRYRCITALGVVIAIFVVVPFVVLLAVALIHDRLYGDWTCMFANCVKVKR